MNKIYMLCDIFIILTKPPNLAASIWSFDLALYVQAHCGESARLRADWQVGALHEAPGRDDRRTSPFCLDWLFRFRHIKRSTDSSSIIWCTRFDAAC